MKKWERYEMYALGLSCLLGLTGCGGDMPGDGREVPQTVDTAQNDRTTGSQETPEGGQGNEAESEAVESGQEAIKPPESGQEEAAENKNAVYSQDGLYMSVSIPDDWDCRIKTKEEFEKEDGTRLCEIAFWPENNADTVFELAYETAFGICGTGVTIKEFTLSSGLSGYRYTEEIEDTLWLTITFRNPDPDADTGTYLISASPELSVWESIEPEFEEILRSIWVGSLPTGQPAVAAADGPASGQQPTGAAETPVTGREAGENGDVVSSQRPNAEITEYISLEEAKNAALANAKLTAADVIFTEEKLEYDDGVAEYDIEFYAGKKEYSYSIDAVTGAILEIEIDAD